MNIYFMFNTLTRSNDCRPFVPVPPAVLLWRKDFDLSLGGISYRVLGCRLEFLEIDFLSGWLRSRGKLPCLGVVVGGLELRLEALLAEGCGDGGEGVTRLFLQQCGLQCITTAPYRRSRVGYSTFYPGYLKQSIVQELEHSYFLKLSEDNITSQTAVCPPFGWYGGRIPNTSG